MDGFESAGGHESAVTADGAAPLAIVHVVSTPTWGGMEDRAVETALWQHQEGHRVHVVADPEGDVARRAGELGLALVPAPFRAWSRIEAALRLPRVLAAIPAGVNMVIDAHDNAATAACVFARRRAALVYSRHTVRGQPNPGATRRLRWRHLLDRFIVCSERGRQELLAEGAGHGRVDVVVDWARDAFFGGARRHASEGRLLVAAAGVLRADNGFLSIIEAFARGLGDMAAELVIAGAPPGDTAADRAHMAALRGAIAATGLGERIRLIGRIGDMPGLLREADIFVACTSGGGPTRVIPEAFASGVAVVARHSPSVAEFVRDGQTGLIAQGDGPGGEAEGLAAGLRRLALDAGLRARVAAAAADFARARLTLEAGMRATLASYRAALAGRGPAAMAAAGPQWAKMSGST